MRNIADLTETVYEHLSGEETFTVTAAERWSKAMVRRLKEKYPDEVDIRCVNDDGSMVVHFPFSWMRIVAKRMNSMTKEERESFGAHMQELRKARQWEKEAITDD